MSVALEHIDLSEVLRYMGTPPDQADFTTQAAAEWAVGEVLHAAVPRWAYRVWELDFVPEGVRLPSGLLLSGQDLKRHLAGCTQAAVFCATLGAGVDALLRRAQSGDMLRALALDCCASAAVEEVCEQIEAELRGLFPDRFFPFRFSPGYGDLPIEVQNDLLYLLDAPRRVGLCASATHILTPRKSVTAILGVSDTSVEASRRSCQSCPARESCQYRKSGGHCGL